MLIKKNIDYVDGQETLAGYYVYDDAHKEKKPGILIAHDWTGKTDFSIDKAEKLAQLGYVGFALDMFGQGKTSDTKEEKMALIQPFMQDRLKLQKRMLAALETIKKLDVVDSQRIGAIGFCFGGLCVLDLARSGADVKAVVSFHGLLNAPEKLSAQSIHAKILALHGFDDPMVSHEQVIAFGDEMTKAKADWQLDMYGNTMHAFTNPQANDPAFGTVYSKKADTRSWIAMKEFFKEMLS